MAQSQAPDPVLLVIAVFSRHQACFDWALERLQMKFGPLAFMSLPYEFNQTSYYEATMGRRLRKQFAVFQNLVTADSLTDAKLFTNGLEKELADTKQYSEKRPLNLDPGILNLGKFMLATTKDQAHRIYLANGTFAEVTLRFQQGVFEPWPWTYADYRQACVLSFMNDAREFYRRAVRGL